MPQLIWAPLEELVHMISSPEAFHQLDSVRSLLPALDPVVRILLEFCTSVTSAIAIRSVPLFTPYFVHTGVLATIWQLGVTDTLKI